MTMTRPPRYALPCLLALVLLGSAGVATAAEEILAPGNPPLTRQGLYRFTGFVEWLLEVPLTTDQKQLVEQSLRDAWAKGDQEEITGYVETLGVEAQVAAATPEQRRLIREQALPDVLQELRSKPDDEGARWALGVYEAGHQPIAAGQPPLTRQVTDAFVELYTFMLSEATGKRFDAPAEVRDDLAKYFAAGYPDLTPEAQAEFSRMPLIWAAFQYAWPLMTDADKGPYRAQFKEMFKPQLEKIRQAEAAAEAEARKQQAAAAAAPQTATQALADLQRRSAQMAANNMYWQTMNNVMRMQADTARIMAANLGSSYTYQYRY